MISGSSGGGGGGVSRGGGRADFLSIDVMQMMSPLLEIQCAWWKPGW